MEAMGDDVDLTDAQIALALLAGEEISVPDDELKGAVRRALLVLAAGGNPGRGLDLGGRAAETVADDLDSPFRRAILTAGLEALRAEAVGFSTVAEVIESLRLDDDLAWRAFSAARLVEALERDELADG